MKLPIRVLHVVVNMNRGGAETFIMNLYRNIDRTQVQFDFLTCRQGEYDSEIASLGGGLFRVPYVSEVGHFKYIRELKRFFEKQSQIQIIHTHMDKMSALVLREAKRNSVSLRIAHGHSTRSDGGIAERGYKWLVGFGVKKYATHKLACSASAARWLYPHEESVTLVPNGIEYENFMFSEKVRNEVRKELNISPESLVIGHVARFSPEKNHSFLIDIFHEVSNRTDAVNLVLVGDGPLRQNIARMAHEWGLEQKVRFLGVRSDVPKLLQAFDVFVLPSLYEGLPVSVVEAQAAGLPCIVSDRVSTEIDLGFGLVTFESVEKPRGWVEQLQNPRIKEQRIVSTTHKFGFDSSPYNIRNTSKRLQDFYLQSLGR